MVPRAPGLEQLGAAVLLLHPWVLGRVRAAGGAAASAGSWVRAVKANGGARRVFGVLPAPWTSSKRDVDPVFFLRGGGKKSTLDNSGLNQPFPARNHLVLPVLLVPLGPGEHLFVPGLCSCAWLLNPGP